MKTVFIAAAAMAGGAALAFSMCWATARLASGNHAAAARLATVAKKKMGTMDKVLILEGVILVAYTAAEAARASGSGRRADPVEPPTEREEPPDVGI